MRSPLLLSLLAAACTTSSLNEVRIIGGTDELRAQLRDELVRFESWVGEDRIRLSAVEITELPDTYGQYRPVGRRIVISDAIPSEELRRVTMRHELCHAIDRQNDLLDERQPVFDELMASLTRPEAYDPERFVPSTHGYDQPEHELFADLCERGPQYPKLLQACSELPPALSAASEVLVRQVFTGQVSAASSLGDVVTWTAPFVPERLFAVASGSGILLTVGRQLDTAGQQLHQVGLSIEDATPQPVQVLPEAYAGYDVAPEPPLPRWAESRSAETGFTADDGSALDWVEVTAPGFEETWSRFLVLHDVDAAWTAVEACPRSVAGVFRTDAQFFAVWADRQNVRWAPVSSPEG